MEIFYVDNDGRSLLAIFHPGNENKLKKTGVIICNPLGQEYLRFHKAIVVLAKELSQAGYPTFRFDYYGTGDSTGDETDLNLASTNADLKFMAKEIKEGCDIDNICLIGVRYGCIPSLLSLNELMTESVVLWNPIFLGKKYVEEMALDEKDFISGSFAVSKKQNEFESLGFSYSESLISSLSNLNFSTHNVSSVKNVLILADNGHLEEHNTFQYPFLNRSNLTVIENSISKFWLKRKDERTKSIVPSHEIKKIVEWMELNER